MTSTDTRRELWRERIADLWANAWRWVLAAFGAVAATYFILERGVVGGALFAVVVGALVIAVDLSWGKLGPYRHDKEAELAPREVPGWLGRIRPEWLKAKEKGAKAGEAPSIPSIFTVFMTSLDIVEMRVARSRLAGDPADVLVTPLLPNFATMDFHRATEAIEEGRAAVERMGPLLQQVLR